MTLQADKNYIIFVFIQMANNIATQSIKLIHEPINEDYEWIQYNNELRIIHSIKDDMYQMQSIIDACHSSKLPKDWFRNKSANELLHEFARQDAGGRIPLPDQAVINYIDSSYPSTGQLVYALRLNLPSGLQGYYIHRLLVNAVAMWASPKYALHIFMMLDEIAMQERNEMQRRIDEQNEIISKQEQVIIAQQPRLVPEHKERRYTYMVWYEDHPFDNTACQLHLVRRNNDTFKQVADQFKDKVWFIKHDLPIAMTPNEDIKTLIRNAFNRKDCHIKANVIAIRKSLLKQAHDIIVKYFDEYTA